MKSKGPGQSFSIFASTSTSPAAASYAFSGLIDWRLAAVFIVGGIAGGLAGARAAKRLSAGKETLRLIFAAVVAVVGVYVVTRGIMALTSAAGA